MHFISISMGADYRKITHISFDSIRVDSIVCEFHPKPNESTCHETDARSRLRATGGPPGVYRGPRVGSGGLNGKTAFIKNIKVNCVCVRAFHSPTREFHISPAKIDSLWWAWLFCLTNFIFCSAHGFFAPSYNTLYGHRILLHHSLSFRISQTVATHNNYSAWIAFGVKFWVRCTRSISGL